MKVRHKGSVRNLGHKAAVYDVLEESANYYIVQCADVSGAATWAAKKSEYEPIPTETWREVTGECVVHAGDLLCHGNVCVPAMNGYRLRKVQLHVPDMPKTYPTGLVWAFIVEKRES